VTKKIYLISFIGTDGSGKTTLAKQLESNLSVPVTYVYFGLKDFHISWLNSWVERKGDRGLFFRLVLLPLEYIIRQLSFPSEGIVILDRIPGWPFAGKSKVLFWIYKHILPTVDLMVHCTGDPKLITERKPERSLKACEKDLIKWGKVIQSYPARHRLTLNTTNEPIESCLARLDKLVVNTYESIPVE
jgi:hypothetical protein